MNQFSNIAVAVITGVAAAALFWLVQAKSMRPRVRLCKTVAHFRRATGFKDIYQIKISNRRRRAAADVRVHVRFRMRGLVREGVTEKLDGKTYHVPWMASRSSLRFPVRPNQIGAEHLKPYAMCIPSQVLSAAYENRPIPLDIFLDIAEGSEVEVIVFATDVFSGAVSIHRKLYDVTAIKEGRFAPKLGCGHVLLTAPAGDDDTVGSELDELNEG